MHSGGHISEIPKPHRRLYCPEGEEPHPVKVTVGIYDLVGGQHYHVDIVEQDNPIWNVLTNVQASPEWEAVQGTEYGNAVIGWQCAWDDEEGEGRAFYRNFNLWIQAEEFVRGIIAEHFAGDGYYVYGGVNHMPIEEFLARRRPTRAAHVYRYEGD